MKDQHEKIKGYRDLSQEEIDLINECKAMSERCGKLIDVLRDTEGLDERWLELGITDLQTGWMKVIRSIAQPTTF